MWVLNKRVARNLRANVVRWCAILFMVILCVYLVTAYMGDAITAGYNHAKSFSDNNARSGRFTALAELNDDELKGASELGFDIEREFYLDYPALEEAKLRVFRLREKVDLVFCDSGNPAQTDSEAVVEKHFCEYNDFHVGDKINIAGLEFTISGIGGSPDAEYVFDIDGETTNHKIFGNCFVNAEGYERLRNTGEMIGSEIYRYAYKKLSEDTEDSVLEDYLRDIEFDETRIKNRFFTEMLNDILKSKINIENAMNDMNDACDDLKETSDEFARSARDMCDAAEKFYDAVNDDLVSGINDLADGVSELNSNSADLNNGAGDIFDLFLRNAESSLAQYGINRELTRQNYASVLSSVSFADAGNEYAQTIDTLLSSLRQVDEYCSGVRTYTSAVGEASSGAADLRAASEQIRGASQQFVSGLGQYVQTPEFGGTLDALNSSYDMINSGIAGADDGISELSGALSTIDAGSSQLREGSDLIFDMLLSDISSRISAYGTSVTLTRDNYESAVSEIRNNISKQVPDTASQSMNDLICSLDDYRTFYDGIADYTAGVDELNDSIAELHDSMPDLVDNAAELRDAALEFADHTAELKDGVEEFSDAIGDFNDNIDELDEFFDIDVDIIETFEPLSFHTGVQNTADRNMNTAETCGIIVFMIVAFIFTVFISHEIDNESSVIGAMYSMGVKKWSLIRHYLIIPITISLAGGIIGTAVGLSPIGVGLLGASTENFYSMPKFVSHIDYRILAMGVFAPVIISAVVTVIIVNKKLSNSPLSMLRHEKKIRKIKARNLDSLPFITAFRIKQFFNELGTSLMVFFGMLLPLMFLMLALNFAVSIDPFIEGAKNDIKFEELCVMKYAPSDVPENCEDVYIETLDMKGKIGNCSVSVMGIQPNSKCFGFSVAGNRINTVSIGTGTARKYNMKKGDVFTLYSSDKHRYYTFEVADTVDYAVGLYVFMDIEDMRNVFSRSDDYYNALVSTEKINIEKERLFADYTKDSIIKAAEDDVAGMMVSIYIFIVVAAIVFFIITFLMIKLMIDRAKMNISLMKVFGFNRGELRKLYINGNFYLIMASLLIGMPVSKLFVDKVWFAMSNQNIEAGYDTRYPIFLYLIIIGVVIVMYLIITFILNTVINKIHMSEVLKNRE